MIKARKALNKIATIEMKEQYIATIDGIRNRIVLDDYEKELRTIAKALKALEIIKAKRLNIDEIYHKDYKWYILDHKLDDKSLMLTKEEYKLLKEVLKWG